MAITSVGYDGTVNEAQWSKLVPLAGSSHYGVAGTNDWKVTSHPTLDRGVNIAIGSGWGHGVLDTSDATVSLQGASIASGSRWDVVVARRNWAGVGGVTDFAIIAGSSSKQIPARNASPGSLDDQPIALVQFTAGQTAPTEIIDLRCWGRNGGVAAMDELALTYLDEMAGQVKINGVLWTREPDMNGSPIWTKSVKDGHISLFGAGPVLVGTAPTSGNFLIQAGTLVNYLDGSGYGRCTFPKPFPNGLLTVIITNGDSSIDRQRGETLTPAVAGSPWDNGRKQDFVYSLMDSNGQMNANALHRINWIAIGW